MSLLWKYFPALYVLPFLVATSRIEAAATASELVRWAVLVAGCGFACLAKFRRAKVFPGRLTWVDTIVLAFLVLFLISAGWSIDAGYTIQRAVSLCLLYGSSMWAFWSYADRFSEERLVVQVLSTLGVVLSVNLVVGSLLFPDELIGGRFQGLFHNPNNVGMLTGIALPVAGGRWLRTRRWWDLGIVLVLGVNLMACGTRSAILGVLLAGTCILIALAARRPIWVASLVAVLGIGSFAFSQTAFFEDKVLRQDSIKTGSNRTYFWELGEEYTDKRPYLGHGFGSDANINEYYGIVLSDLKLRGYGVMSSYHGMAVQIGRPLTYLFFGLLWGFVGWCVVVYRRDLKLVIFAGTLASGLVICIFESAIYSAGNCFAFLFWMIFMLAVRRVHYHRTGIRMDRDGGIPRKNPPRSVRRPRWKPEARPLPVP